MACGCQAVDRGCVTVQNSFWKLPCGSWKLPLSLCLTQALHALSEFCVVKWLQFLWAWQLGIEDDRIRKAEGAADVIGRRPRVETRYGTAKPRDDFQQTACTLAEAYSQPNRARQFEECLQAQRLTIDGRDRMQHFQ